MHHYNFVARIYLYSWNMFVVSKHQVRHSKKKKRCEFTEIRALVISLLNLNGFHVKKCRLRYRRTLCLS